MRFLARLRATAGLESEGYQNAAEEAEQQQKSEGDGPSTSAAGDAARPWRRLAIADPAARQSDRRPGAALAEVHRRAGPADLRHRAEEAAVLRDMPKQSPSGVEMRANRKSPSGMAAILPQLTVAHSGALGRPWQASDATGGR